MISNGKEQFEIMFEFLNFFIEFQKVEFSNVSSSLRKIN